MLKKVLLACVLWVSGHYLMAQGSQDRKINWVDSVFNTLTTEEKIGQLFVLPASSYSSKNNVENLIEHIQDFGVGGIIITGGGPKGTVQLINQLQKNSKVPLLVLIRAEKGPGETLDSLTTYPNMLNIGAIADDSLIFNFGKEVARQMKLLGLHMNLAPSADLNISTFDPHTFYGSDKHLVTRKTSAFAMGLMNHGVLASATHHQPGLSEKTKLPAAQFDFILNRIDTTSFYPFQMLIANKIDGIATTHMNFPVSDKRKSTPASISQLFTSEILKKRLGFEGLTITEVPYIQQLSGKSKNESEKLAFEIGHDLLLFPDNINGAIKRIATGVKKNAALRSQLDASIKKILSAKFDAGLSEYSPVNSNGIIERINSPEAKQLNFDLTEQSITLVGNENNLIPIVNLDQKIGSVVLGEGADEEFEFYLKKYADIKSFRLADLNDTTEVEHKLTEMDIVVVSLFNLKAYNKSQVLNWLNKISTQTNLVVCSFGNPYDLNYLTNRVTMLISYGDAHPAPMITAQILFGARQANGQLPIGISDQYAVGTGDSNTLVDRLAYGLPEEVGMPEQILTKIDDIVRQAIDSGATPGCNILVAKDGKVIYNRAFGSKIYENNDPVTQETIYDLASITKVAATLQTVMFMYDKNLIDLNKKISVYLPELKNSNKQDFTIKDILTHQAGLWPYLPFWQQTIKDSTLLPEYYSEEQTDEFPFPVAKELYAHKWMKDSLWHWIINAKIREKKPRVPYDYTYSDMGFYIMQHLAEKLLNQPMEDFLHQNFYEPIGAYTTGFLPLQRFSESQIAPTEDDHQFRQSMLTGYVHDQGAAMHGGIAGHAGLFSNANDLAKLGQMWLQKGHYGGHQYFRPETVELFTSQQYASSRRGIGWDKPTVSDWNGPTSLYASKKTFGHTGFTGTAIWVDPEFNLVYVFLSNRVHPNMFNTKLLSWNIRPRIQDVIYQSIFEYCKQGK